MVTKSMRRNLLASTIMAGTLIAAPAYAQTAVPAEAAAPVADSSDTIIVTGSLLKNPNLIAASPVNVIGANEISLRQSNTAEEILRDLPGVTPDIGSNVNNGSGGAAFVNLRNLGNNRNLVLLNGQRLVPADIIGAVDLNNIPTALVERVDVLTGGAASTYGADAIAGVVNFITKQNFAGLEANASEQITEQGDGNVFRADLTMGANFDDNRGNVVLSVGYQKQKDVLQGDRDFSKIARSATTGAVAGSATSVPSMFDGQASQIDPTTGTLVTPYALYNFNPVNIFQTPFKRFNIYSEAHYDVSDKFTVYSRGMFSKNTVTQILAPGGIFGENLTINYNNPYLPAAAAQQFATENGLTAAQFAAARAATGPTDAGYDTFDTVVNRRTTELGGRVTNFTTTYFDYKAGFKYKFNDRITLDVGGNYGESENVARASGNVRLSRILQSSLASSTTACDDPSNGCVPINLFGADGTLLGTSDAAGAQSFINADTEVTQKTSLAQAHALLSGDFGVSSPFASSPINFAVGGEYRKYKASQTSDLLSQTPGEISGSGGAAPNINGGYEVTEAYGELNAPLIEDRPFFKSLTLEAGIRYSHYKIDAAGDPTYNTTTWKAGGSWEPVEGIKFRGTYQHAVRAPNISELFSPVSTALTNLTTDPCATIDAATGARQFPTLTGQLLAVCTAQGAGRNVGSIRPDVAGQVNYTSGGNLNLKPEKSNSYTFGAVIQPSQYIPGLTISADYYHITISGAIGLPSNDDAIAACFGTATAATGDAGLPAGAATSAACAAIRRDPNTGGLYGNPGTVFGLPLALTNLGTNLTDGIDLSANYRRDIGFAKLALNFTGNWTSRSKFQSSPTSVNRECAGYYSTNCLSIQPKFQWSQRTTLSFSKVDVSLLWRHIDGEKFEPGAGTRFAAYSSIPAYNYFDLALRADVTDNLELTFTATNLFDKDPPQVGYNIGSTAFNSGNTYPSTYDPLGRRYAVNARVKF
jgi:iron complex outermembrane receptor protein